MKMAIAVALLCGLSVGQLAHAEEAKVQRPHWVIIATLIDRTTGERLDQSKLEGRELEFDDQAKCKSTLDEVHVSASERFAIVLTCQKVGPTEADL